MTKDLKKMTVDSLITELHQQFIDSSSYVYENSIFANELLKRDEDLVINEVGKHLKSVHDRIKKLPYADQMEVQQGWVFFLSRVVDEKNINMNTLVSGFDQWMSWSINYS
jgi:hypothetical protein